MTALSRMFPRRSMSRRSVAAWASLRPSSPRGMASHWTQYRIGNRVAAGPRVPRALSFALLNGNRKPCNAHWRVEDGRALKRRTVTQPFRLPTGGQIDRGRILRFTFDGQEYEGHPGDTLASALLANGVRLIARSFKYHRPRGILTAGPEEPSALVQLETGDFTEPNRP